MVFQLWCYQHKAQNILSLLFILLAVKANTIHPPNYLM